ncbi:MAG TPA: phosphotransferase family protein [Acidimicrobiales bacterium]|nr:phosphotransferase family protein [Acidimicrobiales bacterium]
MEEHRPEPEPGLAEETTDDAVAAHIQTLSRDPEDLRVRLQRWFGERIGNPRVSDLAAPLVNGVSSDTVLFELEWSDSEGSHQRSCVARLEPDSSSYPVFPVYELHKQARIMRLARARTSVPVPEILWEETDPDPLGAPFFVMERIEGEVPPDVMPYPFGSWLSEASREDQRRLQDGAVEVLAALHEMKVSAEELAFLEHDQPGDTPLRRHVNHERAYYEWVSADGVRSPLIERGFEWLEEHWPADEGAPVLSWGDARIGNMIFRDFAPVAILDWEMVGVGPREIDIGWMIALHRFLDDIALELGLPGMPHFMRGAEVVDTYTRLTGYAPRDMGFYTTYGALRMASIISREQRRPIVQAGDPLPGDSDGLIIHRASLEAMLEGNYWDRF